MATFGGFGATRQSAEAGGFFGWFMLEAAGTSEPAPGKLATHYRPNGPAFHDLTELVITTGERDQLEALELRLARAFIDHPHNGHFARDIAKSLLRGGLDEANAKIFADLISQIEFSSESPVPVLTARTVEVDLPVEPTPEYQVFLGRRARFEAAGRGIRLLTENENLEGERWWRLRLAAT